MRRRSVVVAVAALAAAASSTLAQTIDFDLGNITPGVRNLTGTTVGASNDIDTYAPLGNTTVIWDQDVIYRFVTSQPLTFSFTSNDPDSSPDMDFFLLTSTATTLNASNLRQATLASQQTSLWFIDSQPAFTLPAGTYFFVIDAWRGNPTTVGTPATGRAGAYNVSLSLVPSPSAAALMGLAGLVATRRRR